MPLAEKFKAARKQSGLGQVPFATKFGVTQGFVSHIETGRNKTIPVALARQIVAALGLHADYFEGFYSEQGKKAAAGAVSIPLLGVIAAGCPIEEPADPGALLPVAEKFAGCVAYVVRGRSMEDEMIADGDYIIVRENPAPPAGATVVAWVEDQGGTVKKLDAKGFLRSRSAKERWSHKLTAVDKLLGELVGVIRVCE